MKFVSKVIWVPCLLMGMISCIPGRQYEELKTKQAQTQKELDDLKLSSGTCHSKLNECENDITQLKKKVSSLQNDTLVLGNTLRLLTKNYEKLTVTYDLLIAKNKELMEGNMNENKLLVSNYQLSQERLMKEQDELKEARTELETKKANLDKLSAELKTSQDLLASREAKLRELQHILAVKDSTVAELKNKVSKALMGFENNGLTVQKKNGKVYVSMDEKLLFASGSIIVDQKGAEALKNLARVLEQNPDINVMVEGHTDNVPYNSNSGAIKDNWDLSVLRATSIVKLLTTGEKIDPKRISAAGRGEFFPLDPENTAQARKKNRRTEIILTPKLDELFSLMESN